MNTKQLVPHIVVVEDDRDILEALQLLLSTRGYTVSVVSTPTDLEVRLENFVPDLMLLDIWVGGNDGRDIAKRLKSDPRTKAVPIIILSANLSTPQIAKDVKADDFVLKPFDVDHLLDVVEKRLRKQGWEVPIDANNQGKAATHS
jgi:DNA-binding response OmpR family regulator